MGNTIGPLVAPLIAQIAPPVNAEIFKTDLEVQAGGLNKLLLDAKLAGAGSIIDLIARTKGGVKAVGTITAVAGSALLDNLDDFTIDDGLGNVVNFTFRTVAPLINDVLFAGGDTAAQVAASIAAAINAQIFLGVSAVAVGAVVTVTHTKPTAAGNQAILEAVVDAGFLVTGLATGTGTETVIVLASPAIGNVQVDRREILVSDAVTYNVRLVSSVAITYLAIGATRAG